MADENATEIVETTPAEIAPVKKSRGPQPKKAAVEATSGDPEAIAVPKTRGRKKRAADTASVQPQAVAKTRAKNLAKKPVSAAPEKQPAETPAPALDEFADLLQLEEENARLRKALAEKLRAENADLRKRLGLV
ncbi:SyrB-like regulator [Ensifer sp. 4252]|uniref:SyrB-like regulator n=1 Tax=Ensifer sp. 4252 TaxID=3373915 RepID=UPI003D24BA3D